MKEYRLQGSFKVADYVERTALLVKNTGEEYPGRQLYTMDLSSGTVRPYLLNPVNARDKWEVLGYRCSDEWVVWEEVSPNESESDPRLVNWRLYCSRLSSVTVGPPTARLVDEGCLANRSRPIFAVEGDELVRAVNDTKGVGVRPGVTGVVRARNLVGGKDRILLRRPGGIRSLSVSESRAVVTSLPTTGSPRPTITSVDLTQGASARTARLPGAEQLAHFPAVHAGWMAWSVFPVEGDWDTRTFLRDPSGMVAGLSGTTIDPCFAGKYLFYEGTSNRSEASGTAGQFAQVWGSKLGDRSRFLLAEDDVQRGRWWQTTLAIGYRPATLVIAGEVAGGSATGTVVRIYDVSGRRPFEMRP
jgi:hypothetical protein